MHTACWKTRPKTIYIANINSDSDDFDIGFQGELAPARKEFAVHSNKRHAVIIKPTTVASALIGIEIKTARIAGCIANEIDSSLQLAQLVMRSAAVRNDMSTSEVGIDMITVRGPQFFADFEPKTYPQGIFEDDPRTEWAVGRPVRGFRSNKFRDYKLLQVYMW